MLLDPQHGSCMVEVWQIWWNQLASFQMYLILKILDVHFQDRGGLLNAELTSIWISIKEEIVFL